MRAATGRRAPSAGTRPGPGNWTLPHHAAPIGTDAAAQLEAPGDSVPLTVPSGAPRYDGRPAVGPASYDTNHCPSFPLWHDEQPAYQTR